MSAVLTAPLRAMKKRYAAFAAGISWSVNGQKHAAAMCVTLVASLALPLVRHCKREGCCTCFAEEALPYCRAVSA